MVGVPVTSFALFSLWTLESCTEVDINTGQLRTSTSVLGFVRRSEVRETGFSKLVAEPMEAASSPHWRRAYDHRPGFMRSLFFGQTWHYYRCGQVASNMKMFCLRCDLDEVPPDVCKRTAQEMIALLRQDDLDGFRTRYERFEGAFPK